MAASRSYASQIPDVSQRTEALSRLLKGVLDWCAAYMDSAAARTAVMEMCSGTEVRAHTHTHTRTHTNPLESVYAAVSLPERVCAHGWCS